MAALSAHCLACPTPPACREKLPQPRRHPCVQMPTVMPISHVVALNTDTGTVGGARRAHRDKLPAPDAVKPAHGRQ